MKGRAASGVFLLYRSLPEPAAPTPLEQLLEAEMLFEAAEDPSAFTVEALVTMLY